MKAAYDSEMALDLLEAEDFDAILVDFQTIVMNGLDVAVTVR